MIKIVRVTEIHPDDGFYSERNKIIGELVVLDTEPSFYYAGWERSNEIIDLYKLNSDKQFHGYCFNAIKFEEVK